MEEYLTYQYYLDKYGHLYIKYNTICGKHCLLSDKGTVCQIDTLTGYRLTYYKDHYTSDISHEFLKRLYYIACEMNLIPLNVFPVKELQAQLDYLKEQELLLIINIK